MILITFSYAILSYLLVYVVNFFCVINESSAEILAVVVAFLVTPIVSYRFLKTHIKLKKLNAVLTKVSRTDELTGIDNRRYFFERARLDLDLSKRYGFSFMVMMIDIDFFKKINDTYGHDVGDKVLIEFSQLIRTSIRKSDIFARFGGEEFIVSATHLKSSNALAFANKIRTLIREHRFVYDNLVIELTISIGFTLVNNSAKVSLTDMIKSADDALYVSKNSGRDKIEFRAL